jgi:crotonobetainyl-CoA:carnitine CoA-transferase CaiB-like acyl-CoA transferase
VRLGLIRVGVLDGIRVLDLSWGIAGPIAGMLLSDHGAKVTKVEPPGGDPFRSLPGSNVWLRGRRSVVLDLREPEDHGRFLELVRRSDVVLTSFGTGVREDLAIESSRLTTHNPRLIDCAITGYGHHSRHRDRPAYEALVAARLGIQWEQRSYLGGPIAHIAGEAPYLPDLEIPEGMTPGADRDGPIFSHTPWASLTAAYLAVAGVSSALLVREATGHGQSIETSLLQGALSMTSLKWQRPERSDLPGFRTWVYDRRSPKGFFQCSDGQWIQAWVPNPSFLLASADGDTLENRRNSRRQSEDPDRIGSEPENLVVLAHYFPQMVEAVAKFSSEDWVRVAAEAGLPLQPVRTPEEALNDASLIAEGAVVDVANADYGSLRQMGILYTLDRTPGQVQGPVPRVGEHSDEVFLELAGADDRVSLPPGSTDGAAASAPLDGVVVLDLGLAVAGPFGTQLLADLGADVIKVSSTRDPAWHASHIAFGCNRGKRSICIDLKSPRGREVLYSLVKRADVFHSNMRRGALERLGCDESSLRKINPSLIYCHTRGFDKGPRSDQPGNDQTAGSLAGITWEDGGCADGGKPFWSLTSLGDSGNGFLSAIGVIQALYHRRMTGEAQAVDTSILNAHLLNASASLLTNGEGLPRQHLDRLQLGTSALSRLYETADGWLCLAVATQPQWNALVRAVPELISADLNDFESCLENDKELTAMLEPLLRTRRADEWFSYLDSHGVPCEISSASFEHEMFDDPEMRDLGLVTELQHPQVGRFEQFGATIDFSETPMRIELAPPLVGQHTREILRESGFQAGQVDALVEDSVIHETLTL